jgi:hypothetical protein
MCLLSHQADGHEQKRNNKDFFHDAVYCYVIRVQRYCFFCIYARKIARLCKEPHILDKKIMGFIVCIRNILMKNDC